VGTRRHRFEPRRVGGLKPARGSEQYGLGARYGLGAALTPPLNPTRALRRVAVRRLGVFIVVTYSPRPHLPGRPFCFSFSFFLFSFPIPFFFFPFFLFSFYSFSLFLLFFSHSFFYFFHVYLSLSIFLFRYCFRKFPIALSSFCTFVFFQPL